MNVSDISQRQRGPPNGAGSSGRTFSESRNGAGGSGGMSKAERFENEKKRIIESCFAKKDSDGSAVGDALFNADNNLCLVLESYITHIRIIEDAAHPSSPPPPNSSPDNKKPRLIIVAVRKSGRVRMHKARENSNGTFSIGKTWVLDDLTCIESFAGAAPRTEEEEARRQSAGGTGFTVTVQKPYYWQAATAKEKDFFIASLIKIYRKYTGGRLPQLISFDPRALEQLAVPSGQQARSNSPSARSETTISPQRPPSAQATQPPSSYTTRELTRDADVEPRKRPSEERFLSRSDSQDHMQTPPGFFPGSDLTQPSSLPVSQTQLRSAGASSPSNANTPPGLLKTPPLSHNEPNLRRLAGTQSVESSRSGNDPLDGRLVPSSSIDRLRSNGKPLSGSRGVYSGFQRSMSPESNYNSPTTTSSVPPPFHSHQNLLPERRRPPIAGSMNSYGQENLDAEFHDNYSTPLSSPDLRREEARPPSRSRDRPRFAGSNSLIASGPAEHSLQTTRQENPNLEMSSAATPDTMDSASLASTKSDKIFTTAPVLTATTVPTPPPEPPTQSEEEVHRPGLGPMIKKKSNKEIANTFRKAATAYNAFKPRAGGAGDKLREEKDKGASGPNGITGVVPAPSFSRTTSQDSVRTPTVEEAIVNLPTLPEAKQGPPAVQITEAADEVPKNSLSGLAAEVSEPRAPSPGKSRSKSPQTQEDRRTKRRSGNSAKYAAALGIDPNLLEGGTVDIESVLADFGWGSEGLSTKKVDELQAEMRREIGRFEAGSWLGHLEQKDERVETVDRMLDKAIAECDALEGLLTLYGVELGTLGEDIAYIEAQSQGLQVQAANQKLLQNELQSLLETISISTSQLQVLREASLGTPEGLRSAEESLRLLYKAMLKIDPKLRQGNTRPSTSEDVNADRGSIGGSVISGIGNMRALQEKKTVYQNESILFLQRLKQYMKMIFALGEQKTSDALEQERNTGLRKTSTKLDPRIHEQFRNDVWRYSQLMLFSREIDSFEWEEMMRLYEQSVKKPYQEEFRDNVFAWKRVTRKTIGDEQDILFTVQEKETESLTSTARKLTVKRGKTVRSIPGDANRNSSGEKHKDGKLYAYEAFSGALEEMTPVVFMEQNFIVDFFHASSLENTDFSDAVTAAPPESRKGPNLTSKKLFDPDRNLAKRVVQMMDEIYSTWPADLQSLVDWAIKTDPLQGVGVLYALETKLSDLEETNQEYLVRTLLKIRDRLSSLFSRFVEEQVRGIEDTKVKIKKRKGVIAFIKTFPNFSTAIENMLPLSDSLDQLEVRFLVNDAYQKINKAMFESLKFIAKETPTVMVGHGHQGQGIGDLEDKEALNYHILLIENMNHHIEEVDAKGNVVLEEWRDKAVQEMSEHMGLYLGAVIRRPLGKLLDFLESTESLILTTPSPPSVASRASHSRSTFKKILSNYDAKEIRRGIETLKKRVDKHFGDADDPNLSRGLVQKVLKECEGSYLDIGERTRRIVESVYEGSLEVEWRRDDIIAAFRR